MICPSTDYAKWHMKSNKLVIPHANRPCVALIIKYNFFYYNVVEENEYSGITISWSNSRRELSAWKNILKYSKA